MNKNLVLVLAAIGIILIAGIGYLLLVDTENGMLQQEVTVAGTVICLPHVDTSGPQTLECAFGLGTDEGVNYALDLGTPPVTDATLLDTGSRIEVSGMFTPRDMLPAEDRTLIYDVVGVIAVAEIAPLGVGNAELDRHVVAGGALSFARAADFGLAISEEQVLVRSVIPPCAQDFDYCLYYNDDAYADTNFASAGLRIDRRTDLAAGTACLTTPPVGYTNLEADVRESDAYSVSVFSPVQSAAAGHASEGALYRLSFDSTCFEFETRIGVGQFANFEPGTIREFTAADREQVENRLHDLLRTVRFTDGREGPIFP